MKLSIIQNRCKGCGLCERLAPKFFRVDDYHQAQVLVQPGSLSDAVRQAMLRCPMEAIAILAE